MILVRQAQVVELKGGGGREKKKRKGAGREQTAITVSGLIKRPSRMEAILILADAFKAATGAHELM